MNKEVIQRYEYAKKLYAKWGVDVEEAINRLKKIPISINCWQGDDVQGFLDPGAVLSGGILATGGYPGAAKTAHQLRQDVDTVLKFLPGKHKFNLHAIYAETDEKTELSDLDTQHFKNWVAWAKERQIGLDFNPTLFSHPMYKDGFTLAHPDQKVRDFWIKHCQKSIKIAEYFARELNQKCINNIWIPDGFKDFTVDKFGPRQRLKESLDEIFTQDYDRNLVLNTMESKLFGIGVEAFTVGSNEFYLGYAIQNNVGLCMDDGHFHPTETVSNKLSAVMNFLPEMLLHVTRPMRWDSDHVVSLDDETQEIMYEIMRNKMEDKIHIALDFFDASINRVAAWIIGTRNVIKALLKAAIEPVDKLKKAENEFDLTTRLALLEEEKVLPWQDVWNYYCEIHNVVADEAWLAEIKMYEKNIQLERENYGKEKQVQSIQAE